MATWNQRLDDEFAELMEEYEAIEPAIERMIRTDERLDRIEEQLRQRREEAS